MTYRIEQLAEDDCFRPEKKGNVAVHKGDIVTRAKWRGTLDGVCVRNNSFVALLGEDFEGSKLRLCSLWPTP